GWGTRPARGAINLGLEPVARADDVGEDVAFVHHGPGAANVQLHDRAGAGRRHVNRVADARAIAVERALASAIRGQVLADAALQLGVGRAARRHLESEAAQRIARVRRLRPELLDFD